MAQLEDGSYQLGTSKQVDQLGLDLRIQPPPRLTLTPGLAPVYEVNNEVALARPLIAITASGTFSAPATVPSIASANTTRTNAAAGTVALIQAIPANTAFRVFGNLSYLSVVNPSVSFLLYLSDAAGNPQFAVASVQLVNGGVLLFYTPMMRFGAGLELRVDIGATGAGDIARLAYGLESFRTF